MVFTLLTSGGNWRAFKCLIAAQYNGIDIEIPNFDMGKENKSKDFLKKNPLGKVPVLDTPEGSIFESNAIARYVARLRSDTGLYGKCFFESGQVDSWIDFSAHELEVPAMMWVYPILGYMPFNAGANQKAIEDCKKALQVLENHLLLRTYLVGESITLADIAVVSALVYPMKFVFDKEFRKPFPCVARWFTTCVNQPEFQAVIGDVPLCNKMCFAEGDENAAKGKKKEAPKKEAAKKESKSDELEEAPQPKKQEHPLAVLNREKPSSMIMDAWKVAYSNTRPLVKSMDWFWQNFDKEGYSVWFADYKYNDENKILFMTSNAVRGFVQRAEELRKYAFGVMDILGEEGKELKITGCWLFRGQSEKHMIEANPDAEYYTWTKVENFDAATKQKIQEYWCNDETLMGLRICDSKVFK